MQTSGWVTVLVCGVSGAWQLPAWGQPAPPAFEVASVKVRAPGAREGGRGGPNGLNVKFDPGSLTMLNAPLKTAIAWAYHVYPYQVSGPAFLDGDRFDIVAKTAAASTEEQIRQMLRQLLADRFKVTLHHETKEMPAYVISVSKTGIKFHESKTEGEMQMQPNGQMGIELNRVTMAELADLIGYNSPFPDPMVNETGLTGKYDISMNLISYAMQIGDHPSMDDIIQVMIQAIQEQLGLKVDHHKAPIDILIIDHAEKAPSEN